MNTQFSTSFISSNNIVCFNTNIQQICISILPIKNNINIQRTNNCRLYPLSTQTEFRTLSMRDTYLGHIRVSERIQSDESSQV